MSNLRRMAKALRIAERFAAIEMHPAVYISVIAINLCVLLVYREATSRQEPHVMPSETVVSAGNVSHHTDLASLPTAFKSFVKPVVEKKQAEEKTAAKAEEDAVPEIKNSGAALAAVPASKPAAKPKKKTRRSSSSYSGLVPPPPPGVLCVPPPPNAPSLFTDAGKYSFLTAVPPPMVLDHMSTVDSSASVSRGSRHTNHHDYSRTADRARTVHQGDRKCVIVSR